MSWLGRLRRVARGVVRVVNPLGWTLLVLGVLLLLVVRRTDWLEAAVVASACLLVVVLALPFLLGRTSVSVRLDLEPQRVTAGESVVAGLTVSNTADRRQLPTMLEVPVGSAVHRYPLPTLATGARHEESFTIRTRRRGVIAVGPAMTRRGDPLGAFSRDVEWTPVTEVLVRPPMTPLDSLAGGLLRDLEGVTTEQITSSDLAFHALREYVPGDDLRHVHWRSSAKVMASGGDSKLLVRQYLDTRRSHATIVVDDRPSAWGDDDDFELGMSVAASIAVRAVIDEFEVSFVCGDHAASGETGTRALDAVCRAEQGGRGLVTGGRDAGRMAPDTSLLFLVGGTGTSLEDHLRAAASFAPEVRRYAITVDPAGRSRVTDAGGLPVLVVAELADLAAVLRWSLSGGDVVTRWLPDRRGWTDVALLTALAGLALAGLAPTFAGIGFWVVGMLGVLLGVAAVLAARALRWPFIVPITVAVLLYLLLGAPVALRRPPTPEALRVLLDQLVFGWKDLLTTLPPVDADSALLALPLLMGLATGTLGALAAGLRVTATRRGFVAAVLPVLMPTGLLSAVILLGVREPASLLLQGVLFAGLAMAWLVLRTHRRVVRDDDARLGGRVRGIRTVSGAVLIALAASLALPVATWSTGSDDERLVLRDHVEPPFDVGQYPSPLSSFRRYVEEPEPTPSNLFDDTLMTVEGVEPGTRIRFAALDRYDGVIWGASNDSTFGGPVEGTFQRVATQISNPATGPEAEVTVTLGEGYTGVWLPTVGALTGLEFEGERSDEETDTFRYNLATSTGVVPAGLQPGDRYSFDAVLTDETLTADTPPAATIGLAETSAPFLTAQAQDWSAASTQPMQQVLDIAARLKDDGKYSDGVRASERFYLAGHHQSRLSDADGGINSPIIVGNDEQYAAWMALLVNQIGVPARVVMGAVVPEGGEVTGEDVSAWVEVQAADGTWRTVPTEAFMDFDRPAELPPRQEEEMSGTNVPPPAAIPPPSTVGEPTDAELNSLRNKRDSEEGFALPAWLVAVLFYVVLPLLVLALVAGVIVGAKTLRRRRRRAAESVSARFAGGWREVTDHARDLGLAITGFTRREESLALAGAGTVDAAPRLARTADSHVFGPRPPAAESAAAYWEDVDAYRASLSEGASRGRRIRAALSLRTFRR